MERATALRLLDQIIDRHDVETREDATSQAIADAQEAIDQARLVSA